jgi:hypothetical protein
MGNVGKPYWHSENSVQIRDINALRLANNNQIFWEEIQGIVR